MYHCCQGPIVITISQLCVFFNFLDSFSWMGISLADPPPGGGGDIEWIKNLHAVSIVNVYMHKTGLGQNKHASNYQSASNTFSAKSSSIGCTRTALFDRREIWLHSSGD